MSERDLFIAAISIADPAERSAWLDQKCGGDAALRRRISLLLQAFEQAGSLLESPAAPVATIHQPMTEAPGAVIGPYKLLEQIGEGGMGTVFMAEQSHPVQRKVALKVIKAGMDSGQVIARFEAERQALALMDHPNIAKVLDAGTTGFVVPPSVGTPDDRLKAGLQTGRPYFVMELVKGVPITTYCDENHLSPKARLVLFTQVCHAVQHAHQKGIIHRDIKPTNVLVTLYDDKPVPKVIDFGVAKATGRRLTERTMFTGYGQIVGTLEYMSPEQARLNALDVDTRGDIYSLGVLLYELLTGSTPFDKDRLREAAFDEMLRMIREEEPPKPSTRLSTAEGRASIAANRGMEPGKLSGLVRGELDWIVMKALEKDRNRRYETANGFAADVQRYLADEPVQACPPSAGYRLRKFARRNKGPVLAAGVIALSLVGGIIGTSWQAWRATQAERLARDNEQRAVAQKRKAQANFELAKDAVDKYLQRVTDNPKLKEKDFFQLRKELLETAVPFCQKFVEERSDDPELEAARGHAYFRLALVRSAMGDMQAAQGDYESLLSIFSKLAAEFPSMPVYRQYLAKSHGNLGLLLKDMGKRGEAEEAYRAALKIQEQLAADFPNMPSYRKDLSKSQIHLSALLAGLGKHGEAEEAYRAALKILEQLAADFPNVPAYREELGTSFNELGALLAALGKQGEAEAAYRAALKIQERLAANFPNVPAYRQHLAGSQNNLGALLHGQGKHGEAEAAYRTALKIQERLAADFPSVPAYRQHLAMNHNNLGVLLVGLGKRGEAEAAYRAALKIQEQLAADFPNVPNYRQDLARSHCNLGGLLVGLRTPEKAEAAYRAALKTQEQLAADFTNVPAYHKELATSHNDLGVLLLGQGKRGEAEAAYLAALKIREQLAADFPSVPDVVVALGQSYTNFGNLLTKKGEPQAALDWLAKAISTLQPVLEKEPRQVTARHFLCYAHWFRALALDALGRHADALQDWDRALALDPAPADQGSIRLSRALSLARAGEHAKAVAEANAGKEQEKK